MTKYVPADAQRPPALLPPRPGVFRAPTRQASTPLVPRQLDKAKIEGSEDVAGDFEDAPLAKRRKIDSPILAEREATICSQEQTPDVDAARPGGLHNEAVDNVAEWDSDRLDPGRLPLGSSARLSGTAPPLPLPTRRWKHKMASREAKKDIKSIPRVRQDVVVPTTPCKVEIPEDGPVIQAPSVADFFPWAGNHAEDVLNEQSVKNGQFDKPPQTWNESNTARSTILGTLKHRLTLQTLSTLYGAVIQQRAQNQRIASSAAFKPPPRVTLTEAKRKAWLSDLAHGDVPLRRLSRTIPQGIRGQLLLEQCLVNAVPISRALWFAKCVGANEIRTLKRKGTSPTFAASVEAKWSKDWTSNIQQFIEQLAQDCGQQDWRTRISYGLRLTNRLYSENLLDKDAFLDWTLTAADNAPSEQLPVWLMILHLYRKDLTLSRRRGGRVAAVLVDKLRGADAVDDEPANRLVETLQRFVRELVTSRPACFLMPQKWQQCESVLRQCLLPDVERHHQQLLDYLRRINERAAGPLDRPKALATSARQSLIQLLDAARAPYQVHELAQECSRVCADDERLLLTTTIEWSCTKFRHGEARLYLAVRLLRLWHRHGYDLDDALHHFLGKSRPSWQFCHAPSLHHLVAELVRSHDFSISRYLQRLTARPTGPMHFGATYRVLSASRDDGEIEIVCQLGDEPTQLLTEIPLLRLPEHVKNLRSTMLTRLGYDVDNESAVLHHCKRFLAAQLQAVCPEGDDLHEEYEYRAPDLGGLAWTLKSELGHWLRRVVAACFSSHGKTNFPQTAPSAAAFTLNHFMFIRGVLEHTEDIAMLADVLCCASDSRDEAVLASVTDSINAHLESLSAMGALDDLHARLSQAYISLKVTKISLPTLAISLVDLASRHPDDRLPVRVLQADLARGDKVTMAAYSPFSDGMAESLQQAGSTFVEDFEAVILSEPNMTEQTMSQMFELVVGRLKKAQVVSNQEESRDSLCLLLLARLRIFRPLHFDRLMLKWARTIVASPDKAATALVLALVNVGCLPIAAIVQGLLQSLPSDADMAPVRHCRRNLVSLLRDSVASDRISTEPARYRFRTAWSHYLANNATDALTILSAIKLEVTQPPTDVDFGKTHWIPRLLASIALRDPHCSGDYGPDTRILLEEGLSVLFQADRGAASPRVDISHLVGLCDDFSLPFCQLQLHITSEHPDSIHPDSGNSMVDALFSLATSDTRVEDEDVASEVWLPLATAANRAVACQLREKAEHAFFAVDVPLLSGRSAGSPRGGHLETSIHRVARHLHVVATMAYTIPETGVLGICAHLNEKLAVVWRALNVHNVPTATPPASASQWSAPPTSTPLSPDLSLVLEYLPLLLRFLCLHRGTLKTKVPSSLAGKQPAQDQVKLLVLLVSIAMHSSVSEQRDLAAHVFDVVATLVDGLTDEARSACARCLRDKMRDRRVNFLFGTMNTLEGTDEVGRPLQLVKEGKGVVGDWKVKQWELLEGGADTSLNLGLFQCREGTLKGEQL